MSAGVCVLTRLKLPWAWAYEIKRPSVTQNVTATYSALHVESVIINHFLEPLVNVVFPNKT